MRFVAAVLLVAVVAAVASAFDLATLFQQAQDDFAAGRFQNAADVFVRLRDQFPGVKELHLNEALCWQRLGEWNKAFNAYTSAMNHFPDDPELLSRFCTDFALMLNERGGSHTKTTLKLQEVVPKCARLLDLAPDQIASYTLFASLLTLLQKLDEAVIVFEAALAKFPDSPSLQLKSNLALTLLRSGKYSKAWEVSRQILDISRTHTTLSAAASCRTIGWPIDQQGWDLCAESFKLFAEQIKIKDPRICPGGTQWRAALNWSEEAVAHPDQVQVQLINPDTAYASYGNEDDVRFIGPPLPIYPTRYHERYIQLVHLPDAFMSGHGGTIHANCVIYSGGHYITVDVQGFPDSDVGVQVVDIDARVASIISHNLRNYYHWMSEAVPRLLFLKQHILDKAENADMKVLVPEKGSAPFIDETLNLPEFASLRHRYIRYPLHATRTRLHFRAGLHLVDWIHPAHDEHRSLIPNAWGVYSPPRQALQMGRDFFHSVLRQRKLLHDPLLSSKGEIVFLSRKSGVSTRNFPNEAVLISSLKKKFGSRMTLHTGKETAIEQAEMFARAKVVLGAHGAGLANFMFAQPGAIMIMYPMNPHVELCFGHLASALGHQHHVITDVAGSFYYGNYEEITAKQIDLTIQSVEQAVSKYIDENHEKHHGEL